MPVAPLKPELGLLAFVKLPPAPETMLHEPLPTLAALAAKVVEEAQRLMSGPALATVGAGVTVTVTPERLDAVQPPTASA